MAARPTAESQMETELEWMPELTLLARLLVERIVQAGGPHGSELSFGSKLRSCSEQHAEQQQPRRHAYEGEGDREKGGPSGSPLGSGTPGRCEFKLPPQPRTSSAASDEQRRRTRATAEEAEVGAGSPSQASARESTGGRRARTWGADWSPGLLAASRAAVQRLATSESSVIITAANATRAKG